MVTGAMNDTSLCKMINTRANFLNVSSLMTNASRSSIDGLCRQNPTFLVTFFAGPDTQPSAYPSSRPSGMPSQAPVMPKVVIVTDTMLGIMTMIVIISILRFSPAAVGMFIKKKVQKVGHLYDILVVLNDDEEAILENIQHEDIAYFRIMNDDVFEVTMAGWMMNVSPEPLGRRYEVGFFDQYGLLGIKSEGDDKDPNAITKIVGNKQHVKEVFLHEAQLQVGMIIRVKEAPTLQSLSSKQGSAKSMGRPNSSERNRLRRGTNSCESTFRQGLDSRESSMRFSGMTKTQSESVLDQLPSHRLSTKDFAKPICLGSPPDQPSSPDWSRKENSLRRRLSSTKENAVGEEEEEREGPGGSTVTYPMMQFSRFLKIERESDIDDRVDSTSIDLSEMALDTVSETEVAIRKGETKQQRTDIDMRWKRTISRKSSNEYSIEVAPIKSDPDRTSTSGLADSPGCSPCDTPSCDLSIPIQYLHKNAAIGLLGSVSDEISEGAGSAREPNQTSNSKSGTFHPEYIFKPEDTDKPFKQFINAMVSRMDEMYISNGSFQNGWPSFNSVEERGEEESGEEPESGEEEKESGEEKEESGEEKE